MLRPKQATSPSEIKAAAAKSLDVLSKSFDRPVLWLKGFVNDLTRQRLVPLFALLFIALFALTVIGYGFGIYAVQNRSTPAFDKLPPTLLRCVVYSLSVSMTASVSDVGLATDTAYMLYGAQLISTFLMLSLFFTVFSTASGMHMKHRLKAILATLKAYEAWSAEQRGHLPRVAEQGTLPPAEPPEGGTPTLEPPSPAT